MFVVKDSEFVNRHFAVRFLHQFDRGSGDYTQERDRWLEKLSQDEIMRDIQQRQQTQIKNS